MRCRPRDYSTKVRATTCTIDYGVIIQIDPAVCSYVEWMSIFGQIEAVANVSPASLASFPIVLRFAMYHQKG